MPARPQSYPFLQDVDPTFAAAALGGVGGVGLATPNAGGLGDIARGGLQGVGTGAGAAIGARLAGGNLDLQTLLGGLGGGAGGLITATLLARALGLNSRKKETYKAEGWADAVDRLPDTVKAGMERVKQAGQGTYWYDVDTGHLSLDANNLDPSRSWALVKYADTPASDLFGPIARGLNFAPASWNKPLGGPSPLLASLTGGAVTAGLGYLGGAAIEKLMPEKVLKGGRLRRTMALLGGIGGAIPGITLGALASQQASPTDSWYKPWVEPHPLSGAAKQAWTEKTADLGGELFDRVPVDAFNRVVLEDPFATPAIQAATIGLMSSADSATGGSGIIRPIDIVRVGIGMGAGAIQAYAAGKILGGLAGLSPGAQSRLQQTGMFAGALNAAIPGLFFR